MGSVAGPQSPSVGQEAISISEPNQTMTHVSGTHHTHPTQTPGQTSHKSILSRLAICVHKGYRVGLPLPHALWGHCQVAEFTAIIELQPPHQQRALLSNGNSIQIIHFTPFRGALISLPPSV